jgi:hypothetical protein
MCRELRELTNETDTATVAVDAVEAVLRLLATLPTDTETSHLVRKALEMQRTVEAWRAVEPEAAERERVMNRILSLHTKVAKLRRMDD